MQKLDGSREGLPLRKLTRVSIPRTCHPLSLIVPSLEPMDPPPHPWKAAADLGMSFFFSTTIYKADRSMVLPGRANGPNSQPCPRTVCVFHQRPFPAQSIMLAATRMVSSSQEAGRTPST